MYTKRIYSLPLMLYWTRRYIFQFVLIATIPVIFYHVLGWKWLHLPWLPIGLIGTALAFIIGFKNNASYDRLWEARKIWGGIVNASRSYTIMVNDFVTNEHAKKNRTDVELFELRKTIIMRHVAWMSCLRHALRTKKQWESSGFNTSDLEHMRKIRVKEYEMTLEEELSGYLSEKELKYVLSKRNHQTACITLQSNQLKVFKLEGLIEDFRHMEMENMLVELFSLQGKAERIKNFPYPRQFATLNFFFVWIFVFLLPFGLMSEFESIGMAINEAGTAGGPFAILANNFVWVSIPFTIVIAWVFFTMERIGDVSANPFEGIANDVPITTMARAIEIDIREMIGDDPDLIPDPHPQYFDTQM